MVEVLSRAEARAELERRGIPYTSEAFCGAAERGRGQLDVVKLFVAAGWSVDKADDDHGSTPLHKAAVEGHLSVVEFLVGAGADLEARDGEGNTALYLAAWHGHLAVVKYLVGLGVDVNATRNSGLTALHGAAWHGSLAVVQFLLGAGADVNATDNKGKTPRDLAEEYGHTAVAKYLDYLESLPEDDDE